MAPTMPNAHRGIRNQGLSNAPYQLPRDSPTRAVPKSANNTHTATATNNGPILSERTNDLPRTAQTRLYLPAWRTTPAPHALRLSVRTLYPDLADGSPPGVRASPWTP